MLEELGGTAGTKERGGEKWRKMEEKDGEERRRCWSLNKFLEFLEITRKVT